VTLARLPELRELLQRRSGLDLGRGGMEANLERFVRERLQAIGMTHAQYLDELRTPGSEELRQLLEAMTVVYTWFFRDPGQFAVVEHILRAFGADHTPSIWVAGCATGEEPYSVALVAARLGKKVDILGTDLNREALRHAREGRYAASSLDAVDPAFRAQFLGPGSSDYVVPDAVKQCVHFEAGNLVDTAPRAPTPGGWDIVICRNVLIYFGREQARKTLDTLASSLAPGGYLILGATEGIQEKPSTLETVGVAGRALLRRPQSESERRSPPLDCLQPQAAVVQPPVRSTRPTACAHRPGRVRESPSVSGGVTASMALERGHAALDSGDLLGARRSYLHAIELEPTCAEAFMFNGITHFLDGDHGEALHQLRGALYLDATLWAACFYQALCYENMGHAEDAARSYAQVLQLAEKHGERDDRRSVLNAWRSDLLNVARSRAHLGTRAMTQRESRRRPVT
jgi:chemotaxis methyl-accepting protein methylase